MTDKSERNARLIFIVICLAIFLFMLTLNIWTPLIADDFERSMMSSMEQVLSSVKYYYLHSGGGVFVTFAINAGFLVLSETVFDFLNAGVFLGMILLMYRLSHPRRKHDCLLLLFLFCAVWVFTICFGQVFLWRVGTVAYMWPMTAILGYLRLLDRKPKTDAPERAIPLRIPAILGFAVFGLIVGWMTPPLSGACLLISLVLTWGYRKRGLDWMLKSAAGIVGQLIGLYFLVRAPGNAERAAYFPNPAGGMAKVLETRFEVPLSYVTNDTIQLFLLFLILFAFLLVMSRRRRDKGYAALFFVGGLASAFSMVLAPSGTAAGRVFLGMTTLVIIACGSALSALRDRKQKETAHAIGVFAALVVAFLLATTIVPGVYGIYHYRSESNKREASVRKQVRDGKRDLSVTAYPEITSKYVGAYKLEDIHDDPSYWYNIGYSRAHGIDSIVTK
ncbi:MAG: DUF6056 family protein [Actinomycetes bacterium]|nr:DUF6056 family protein [Actinomycetes bacterium]